MLPIKLLLIEPSDSDASDILGAFVRTKLPIKCEVTRVRTLQEAVEVLDDADAVLSELNLPDSKGIETLLTLKAVCNGHPIFVWSNLENTEDITEVIRRGACHHASKSYDRQPFADSLLASLRGWVLRGRDKKEKREEKKSQILSALTAE